MGEFAYTDTLSWESPAAGMTLGSEAWRTFAAVTPHLKIGIWTTCEVSFSLAWTMPRKSELILIYANPCNSLEKRVNELVPISPFPCVELRNIGDLVSDESTVHILYKIKMAINKAPCMANFHKWEVNSLCLPVITHRAKYPITNLFLFWPMQLSAWHWQLDSFKPYLLK